MLTIVLLNSQEEFISFLNPDLASITEESEILALRTLKIKYLIKDFEKAKEDFKVGNKIWISGDPNLTDCLYVINTSIERDYFDENNITFEAEEVLVELNYAPPISQTDLTAGNGFTITSNESIVVNRSALGFFFGDYFTIGVVQKCLHKNLEEIAIVGTVNPMDLLRKIESETSNVFRTRYEKDEDSNKIHRYLDFLNQKNDDESWDLVIDYTLEAEEESTDEQVPEDEEIVDDDVEIDEIDEVKNPDPENLKLQFRKGSTQLFEISADELNITNEHEEYEISLEYNTFELVISVIGETYDEDEDDVTSEVIFSNENTPIPLSLPDGVNVRLYDSEYGRVLFSTSVLTNFAGIQSDILDLSYNTENIKYEIDETSTIRAIAPLISSNELNKDQISLIIQRWLDLEVSKGDMVPMIVQKVTDASSTRENSSNPAGNYWARPVKASDSSGKYEYWRGVAYWTAPFSKLYGEMFISDDEDTGSEYNNVTGRSDIDDVSAVSYPKVGSHEVSDEDPYAIFKALCMTLKEKRYPELNIEVDVANYYRGKSNSYDLYDRVYVKIPTFDQLIVATVTKTEKNAHDIGTNKVELSNFDINTKIEQIETEFVGQNATFKYPKSKKFSVVLQDADENPLKNKIVSIALLSSSGGSSTYTRTVYNKKTNAQGRVEITMKYDPGTYQLQCNFGGDTGYEPTSMTFDVHVYGKKINLPVAKKGQKLVEQKVYWNRYGESPKGDYVSTSGSELLVAQKSSGNLIIAIGRAVTSADKKAYGKGWIETTFDKKCARCGSSKLYWGQGWAGKKDSGTFKPTKSIETGSLSGRIICAKCGTSYDVCGRGGTKRLHVRVATKKSSKKRLNQLKKGKLRFGTSYKLVSTKKVAGNNGNVIPRHFDCQNQSKNVAKVVKTKAKSIVKDKTGMSAVKEIAKWISKHIKYEKREGFYQSPSKTLKRKKGSGACITDLFLQMCDAVGVQEAGISTYYVYVHKKKTKSKKKVKKKQKNKIRSHVFARVNGVWFDCSLKKPVGHHATGYGAIKTATISRYPCLPFSKKYK